MKNILLKIANLLYINVQYMENYGLLNGKMGAILFFYEYSRYSGNEVYNDFADRMLDEMLDAIEAKKVDGSFGLEYGLGGIGWGIQYLIDHHFIEEDSEDVLSDFDKRMQENIKGLSCYPFADLRKYLSDNEFYLGIDSYIYARRLRTPKYNIDNLKEIADFYYKVLNDNSVFPMQFLNTCYLFLLMNNPIMKGKYTLLLRNRLKEAYQETISQKRYTCSDLKVMQRLLNEGKTVLDFSDIIMNAGQNGECSSDVEVYLRCAKIELLSFDSHYEMLDAKVIDDYLDKGMEDMPSCNLSLGEGVAGLGLFTIKALQL